MCISWKEVCMKVNVYFRFCCWRFLDVLYYELLRGLLYGDCYTGIVSIEEVTFSLLLPLEKELFFCSDERIRPIDALLCVGMFSFISSYSLFLASVLLLVLPFILL